MGILILVPFGIPNEKNRAIYQHTLYLCEAFKNVTLLTREGCFVPQEFLRRYNILFSNRNFIFWFIEVINFIRQSKCEIVLTYQTLDWIIGLFSKINFGKRWILFSQHSPFYYYDNANTKIRKIIGIININLAKLFYKYADLHIVMAHGLNEGLARWLIKYFSCKPEKIFPAPNGVSIDLIADFIPKYKKDHFSETEILISYIGTISTGKAIEIFRISNYFLSENSENVEFILAGPIRNECKREVEKFLKTSPNVKYLGVVSHNVALNLIYHSDICIYTGNENFRDNIIAHPGKILEYMAFKKAILAPKFEGIEGFLKDNYSALLYDPDNVEDLISKLQLLVKNKQLRSYLGRNAYETVKNYDWRIINRKIEMVIKYFLSKA